MRPVDYLEEGMRIMRTVMVSLTRLRELIGSPGPGSDQEPSYISDSINEMSSPPLSKRSRSIASRRLLQQAINQRDGKSVQSSNRYYDDYSTPEKQQKKKYKRARY